jgi:hypothetical protein
MDPRSDCFLHLKEHITQARGQQTQEFQIVSIPSLSFLTACVVYASSLAYLAREDRHKYRTAIRWSLMLVALLVCLNIEPHCYVLGSLVYQYIPLAALAAEAFGMYLSPNMTKPREPPQPSKGKKHGPE